MSKPSKRGRREESTTIKGSTLVIGLLVGLAFSILLGITAGAIGLGSLFPQMNLIAKPFVCPDGEMSYSQHVSEIGTARYYSAKWFCANHGSGAGAEIDANSLFVYAGSLYGLAFFAVLLIVTYFYWNSSIGPAKNGGPRLW